MKNTITVGTEEELDLFSRNCILADWVGSIPEPEKVYGAKIRYRQEDQECLIMQDSKLKIKNYGTSNLASCILHLEFANPQRAIASGQICVLYDSERVIGSGIIQ